MNTVFTHHGSALDAATELQLKGRRWYDPDSGKFLSEDPIAADINTYRFAGNDPTNYADPTGLSQAGHPLGGGFSGGGVINRPAPINNFVNITPTFAGLTTTPTIDFSRSFDASLYRPAGGFGSTPVATQASPSVASGQLVSFAANASPARFQSYLDSLPDDPNAFNTYRQGLSVAQRNAVDARLAALPKNRPGTVQQGPGFGSTLAHSVFVDQIYGGGKALVTGEAGRALGERGVGISETLSGDQFNGSSGDWFRFGRGVVGDLVGVNGAVEAAGGYDISNEQALDGWERWQRGAGATAQLAGGAAGVVKLRPTTRTNAALVDEIGSRAGKWAQRSRQQTAHANTSPQTVGIKQHGYADRLLTRHQRLYGDRGLRTEVSVIQGRQVPYGTSGSVRLDVLEGNVRSPTAIYDYKFGEAGLSSRRINKLRNTGNYPDVPIIEVHRP